VEYQGLMLELSLAEARRIAIASQGLYAKRPARVTMGHVREVVRRLGLLQLDHVNVVTPAHYTVLFSRLGPFDKQLLDRLVFEKREFAEHWAHEASIIPVEHWPLLAYRRRTHEVRPRDFGEFLQKYPAYVAEVLEAVRERGPVTPDQLHSPAGESRKMAFTWFGTVPRATLEAHFGYGEIAIANRLPNFTRVYDLAERVIPAEHRRDEEDDAGRRGLLRVAARGCGVGTAADLADYFRMRVPEARPRLAELVEAGELQMVKVEGWREAAYLWPGAERAAGGEARALLAPFDPLVWFRPRALRLFGFEYRFEIFVPAEKRQYGCYVLPFLLGDRLVGRVDLKADRAGGRLRVLSAHLEAGAAAEEVAPALAAELRVLAGWLGLGKVQAQRRGGLARPLAAALVS
jgi:uncharacterized protein YcaQ